MLELCSQILEQFALVGRKKSLNMPSYHPDDIDSVGNAMLQNQLEHTIARYVKGES